MQKFYLKCLLAPIQLHICNIISLSTTLHVHALKTKEWNPHPIPSQLILLTQGLQRDVVYLGWPIAHSYMNPNAGGGGSCGGLSRWVQLCTGAQINFGDLTPYLTFNMSSRPFSDVVDSCNCVIMHHGPHYTLIGFGTLATHQILSPLPLP
jgi:hypothetical protein